ncbi:predicted protein [Nematostella vectensis]|uniref:Uncharacterized protein n=1 Tax=Nematostella vectensis TaxID=45351 RepID=A7RUW6_NEMVE|nr:predicted protein [Nematostella vectensis]|eukprot:XP_001636884.1 predicted protein [Nematostella vectensis]
MRDNPFLDEILSAVWSQDTQKRLRAAEDLSNYLNDPSNDIVFHGYERLIDGLVGWVNSSNFRVSLSGLEILHQIVDQMGERFKHSLLPVWSSPDVPLLQYVLFTRYRLVKYLCELHVPFRGTSSVWTKETSSCMRPM